jgi:hypothetical protein
MRDAHVVPSLKVTHNLQSRDGSGEGSSGRLAGEDLACVVVNRIQFLQAVRLKASIPNCLETTSGPCHKELPHSNTLFEGQQGRFCQQDKEAISTTESQRNSLLTFP